MGRRWNPLGFQLYKKFYFLVLTLLFQTNDCLSLNLDGLALLDFRAGVVSDPHCIFENWNPNDEHPCKWSGVHCVNGKVQTLDLKELSLGGILRPALGNLSHLKSLILNKNRFIGIIPKELGRLTVLELLDLRTNGLSGSIPAEIGQMSSLKSLLLCDNKFQGSLPPELGNLSMLFEVQFDQSLISAVASETLCQHRRLGHCFSFRKCSFHADKEGSPKTLSSSAGLYIEQSVHKLANFVRRRLLQDSTNLPAAPSSNNVPIEQNNTVPSFRSSGSFPAIPNGLDKHHPPPVNPIVPSPQRPSEPAGKPGEGNTSWKKWKYLLVVPGVAFVLAVAALVLCICRSHAVKTIGPWKTGISGQLQKAFVTGVPKLNRPELESACEDFSNIIDSFAHCTVYKGTLSSGVEIAVASTSIKELKYWSNSSEKIYRKKIDTLSRVNHKNFVNLLGYCEEDESFLRMMVFEYAPNGTLFEHLHVKEVEHLDWNTRMRIIMGTAYCLQYMHYELNPPVAHSDLHSSSIYLTDDYAAKLADLSFWTDIAIKSKVSSDNDSVHAEPAPAVDMEGNVYSFGLLLLEIISGKLPNSDEQGSLLNWASQYLNDKRSISYMIDPTLKSFKNDELDIICEIIQDSIHPDPRQRPTMNEITSKLREVIAISPDSATPRLSPLWWAELEILSVEAT
ncbi:hypothetical protein Scep_027876 [Stephania cephalantha]|uniref:Protein kinase domain-containing protein n=1 Tax=Stephania cephalantha TaxID=152367 RepID=A0AAP0EH76_9MAGN